MKDRYELLNQLYQMIMFEQAGKTIPEDVLTDKPHLVEIKQAIGELAQKICRVSGADIYATQLAFAKLFTAGLVEFERGEDGEVRLRHVENIDLQALEEYSDNLKG